MVATIVWTSVGLYHLCGLSPAFRPRTVPTFNVVGLPGSADRSLSAHGSYPTPLTITIRAEATLRASDGVGSYECGSALGLVMMLVTRTREPPSCVAMLP